jgi:ribosome maturation factor RimP
MQKFISQVHSKAEEFAKRYKLKVYEVAFRREKTGMVLRISLDGVVSLDMCANISRSLSDWLDGVDVPVSRYSLEVSSLGINRPLKSEAEFAEYAGSICRITVKTKDESGRKRYRGRIIKAEDGKILLSSDEEKQIFTISADNILKANLDLD